METKQQVTLSVEVESIEKAKELLADLEVLDAQYNLEIQLFIRSQVSFEALYEQTE